VKTAATRSDAPIESLGKSRASQQFQASKWTARPLKRMAWAMLYERGGRRFTVPEVTHGVIQDFQYAKKYGMNATIGVKGGFGEGKSEDAQRFGLLWTALTGGKLEIFFDVDETPIFNTGDFGILDEWIIPEGPGKIQAIRRFWNLVSTIRIDQVCICLCNHSLPRMAFLTFVAETYLQNWEDRQNLVRITVPLPEKDVWIGNALIPLHNDQNIRTKYLTRKKARVANLIATRGKKVIAEKLDFPSAALTVLKEAQTRGWVVRNMTQARGLLYLVAKEEDWDINYDTEVKLAALITLEADKIRRETQVVISGKPYIGQTADLRKAVSDCLIENYGVASESMKMLMEYAQGETQADIGKRHNMSQPDVSDALTPIREKLLGYAFEDVYAAKLKQDGFKMKQQGKNTPEPDILILNDKGEVVKVFSAKCYFDKKDVTTIPRGELAKTELVYLDNGIPLTLVYYDFVTDKLFIAEVGDQERFSFRKAGTE